MSTCCLIPCIPTGREQLTGDRVLLRRFALQQAYRNIPKVQGDWCGVRRRHESLLCPSMHGLPAEGLLSVLQMLRTSEPYLHIRPPSTARREGDVFLHGRNVFRP